MAAGRAARYARPVDLTEGMSARPRLRVIVDNDFAGDPDDLVQLAHHLLSPSVEVVGILVSRIPDWQLDGAAAIETGVSRVRVLLDILDRDVPIYEGSTVALGDGDLPLSPAARAIIDESRRDVGIPLVVALGGALTELALAARHDPMIAGRLTAVWIGGPEYDGAYLPAGPRPGEYNTLIDPRAVQEIFASTVPLWQVPRDVYRTSLVSWAELDLRFPDAGRLGEWLLAELRAFDDAIEERLGIDLGETFVFGDSALVLLTALSSSFAPEPTGGEWQWRVRRHLVDATTYGPALEHLPPVRVFTRLDTRLMFDDMFAKFTAFGRRTKG
jgi:purine nucleosidase